MGTESEFSLRPATAEDFPTIRALVRAVKINPIGLAWQRFLVAVDGQGQIIGCGQVKHHFDGSQELASIAVQPEWRRQGVASAIINCLLDQHPGTIFLTCRPQLEPFYQPFGFRAVETDEMTSYYRRIVRLARLMGTTGLIPVGLLVMRRDS